MGILNWFIDGKAGTASTAPPGLPTGPPIEQLTAFSPAIHDIAIQWAPIVLGVTFIIAIGIYSAVFMDALSWFFHRDRSSQQLKRFLNGAGFKINQSAGNYADDDDVDGHKSRMREKRSRDNAFSYQQMVMLLLLMLAIFIVFGYTTAAWALLLMSCLFTCGPLLFGIIGMAAPTGKAARLLNAKINKKRALADMNEQQQNSDKHPIIQLILSDKNYYISVLLLLDVLIAVMSSTVIGVHWGGPDGGLVGSGVGMLFVISIAIWDVMISFVYPGVPYQAPITAPAI